MTADRRVCVHISNNHRLEDRRVVDDALKTEASQIDRLIFKVRQVLGNSPTNGRSVLQTMSA